MQTVRKLWLSGVGGSPRPCASAMMSRGAQSDMHRWSARRREQVIQTRGPAPEPALWALPVPRCARGSTMGAICRGTRGALRKPAAFHGESLSAPLFCLIVAGCSGKSSMRSGRVRSRSCRPCASCNTTRGRAHRAPSCAPRPRPRRRDMLAPVCLVYPTSLSRPTRCFARRCSLARTVRGARPHCSGGPLPEKSAVKSRARSTDQCIF